MEGLDVEPPVDVGGGGVVNTADEAQVVHTLAQVLDDGEPQGALLLTVDARLLLCADVAHGAVTTHVVGVHRRDDGVVVDARTFSDGIELADGVVKDAGEGLGLLRLD